MKAFLACIVLVAGIAPAVAGEAWICTFPGIISPVTVRERFEVRATDVLRDGAVAYRIIENSTRGVVAAYVHTPAPDTAITIGTLAIDKPTGNFVLGVMVPGEPLRNKVVPGKCEQAQ